MGCALRIVISFLSDFWEDTTCFDGRVVFLLCFQVSTLVGCTIFSIQSIRLCIATVTTIGISKNPCANTTLDKQSKDCVNDDMLTSTCSFSYKSTVIDKHNFILHRHSSRNVG